MTFTLTANLLQAVGGRLSEARVTRIVGDVFYGVAVVEGPTGTQSVDARPSDVINLALVAGAPIRVEASVFERAESSAQAAREAGDWRTAYFDQASEGADEIAALITAKQAAGRSPRQEAKPDQRP
jgi:bifunctional DNase/RNase